MNRLARDINALNQYRYYLVDAIFKFNKLIEAKQAEIEELIDISASLADDYNDLAADLDNANSRKTDLEAQLEAKLEEINGQGEGEGADTGLQGDLDEAESDYEEAVAARNSKAEERDQVQDDMRANRFAFDVAKDNRDSALAAAKEKNTRAQLEQAMVYEMQSELATLPPDTTEYDNLVLSIDQKLLDIDDFKAEAESMNAAAEGYNEEMIDLNDIHTDLDAELRSLTAEVQQLQGVVDSRQTAMANAYDRVQAAISEYGQIQQELLSTNQTIPQIERALESLEDDLDIGDSEGDITAGIKVLQNTIAEVEGVVVELETEEKEAGDEATAKTQELNRLKEASVQPVVPELTVRPETGDSIKSSKQLREVYEQMQETDREESKKQWWPNT